MRTQHCLPLLLALIIAAPATAQVVGVPPPPPPPPRPPGMDAKMATGTASIKGRVVAADTGRPLRRAAIRVSASELGGTGKTATTDPDGLYEIDELPAGRYTINVTRGGYLPMQHGQRRFGEGGAPLQIADGEAHDRVDFTLARASSISGRVTDESGQPLAGASLRAMQLQYFEGQRQPVPVGGFGSASDETGEFRISGVPPGDVYVMASSRETWVDDKDPAITYGFSPSYYPGTTMLGEAQRVRVGVGQDVASIEFALVPARAATLSGVVLGLDGTPAGGGSIMVQQDVRGPTSMSMSMIGSTRVNADGSWRLERILPGEYTLRATSPGPDGRNQTATMPIVASGSDVEGIVIAADPGAFVSGTVQSDDGTPLPTGTRRVFVNPVGPTAMGSAPPGAVEGVIGDDGAFSRQAPSGRVTITVLPMPPGWAIKSVDIRGENYAGRRFDLPRASRLEGVRIVLTNRFPTLAGTLTDERGAPSEGTVILFPQDESAWEDGAGAIRSTRPDQSGQYRFAAVRPGDYYLVAVEAVPSWQVNDPEFLATLTGHAVRLTMREGQHPTQNLQVRR
jgi:protocatechuate 3,4-dioxygenase beta subunit